MGAAAGKNLAGVVSELGGKAPLLVFPDSNVDQVVNSAAFAAYIASGQVWIWPRVAARGVVWWG